MSAHMRITRPSGLGIGVTGLGDPISRRIVMICHPTPGACGFDPDPDITNHWGVRLLTADRPGYDSSDPWGPHEIASARTWADYLAEWISRSIDAADQLSDIDYRHTIGVVGWGAGGAYALELVRALGGRVDRLALVSTPRPDRLRDRLTNGDPDVRLDDAADDLVRLRLEHMLDDAATQGDAGAAADTRVLGEADWSADITHIAVPTLVVDSDADPNRDDAEWWRRGLPQAQVSLLAPELPLVAGWSEILEHVAPDHGEVAGNLT